MIALSEEELLSVWDAARSVPSAMRPAALLETLDGDANAARLPIGTRDRRLLVLREELRGSAFEGIADCPACATRVELSFDTPASADSRGPAPSITMDSLEIELRLPDSHDVAAVSAASSIEDARAQLAARCITRVTRGGEEMPLPALDDTAISAISEALAAADPDGDLSMSIVCPDCRHEWDVWFDPATYVWSELESAAIATMREVDALASAYGWSEQQILSIPPARRRVYLGMVLG
jgi:hypothetical protein